MFSPKFTRNFSTSLRQCKSMNLKNTKNKSVSSQIWLKRQISDPYVEKAAMMNYRCRSAFKLVEMDDRFKFLSPGQTVIDCGASPGSWTQVAVKRVNADASNPDVATGKVVAVDKQHIYPISGAIVLGNMDFTKLESQKKIIEILNDQKADSVISDMAPSATGIRDLDTENIIKLCYAALGFAVQVSKDYASLVVKLWQCGATKQLEKDILRFYESAKIVKPHASRADSTEIFILARNFKGLKKT